MVQGLQDTREISQISGKGDIDSLQQLTKVALSQKLFLAIISSTVSHGSKRAPEEQG